MNRSSKLFIAAVLLAAGYGVASLLGSPNAPYLAHALQRDAREATGPPTLRDDNERRAVPFDGGVRLLPDVATALQSPQAESATRPRADELSPATAPLAAVERPNRLPPPASAAPAAVAESVRAGPRASFKNVPPRPLNMGGEHELLTTPPAARQRNESAPRAGEQNVAATGPRAADSNIVASSYLATGAPELTLAGPAGESTATRSTLTPAADPTRTASPESPRPALTGVLRVHTVVDGDSLPKLAARYLRDAKRSEEIFALNRDVLSSPDLLPIGAELKIPPNRASGRGG